MRQIRLRARPQIQVKLKPKIVLTDFILEISGTLHYALLMIPTGSGIRVIGGGDARRPVGGIPVTGEDARRLVQGCMQIADFGVTLDVQEGTSILPVMSVSFWAVFEKNKKRKKKFSMKTSSAETKSVFGCLFGYLLGVKYALVPHLDWTHFNFPTSIHAPFHMEFPSLMSRLVDEGSDLKKRT